MGEQSHVEAMRAAIRGDFERLERRRGTQELMRITRPASAPGEHPAEEPHLPPAPARRRWLDRFLSR